MSSKQHTFELNGKKYGFSLPEGQELTEDLIRKIVEKIEKKEEAKANAVLASSVSDDTGTVTEKEEDKNLIDTQENSEDALKAKNNTLEQAVQANFENAAEEKTKESSVSHEHNVFSNESPTISSVLEETAENLQGSEVIQNLAAAEMANVGLQGLNDDIDEAYPLFVDEAKSDDKGILDVDAHEKQESQKDEGVLNRNVSEKDKANDDVLGLGTKEAVQNNIQHAQQAQSVQELDGKETAGTMENVSNQEHVGSESSQNHAAPLGRLVEGAEKSLSSEVKNQEAAKSDSKLIDKTPEKTKTQDKNSKKPQKDKAKIKIGKDELKVLFEKMGRPVPGKKKESSPYQKSRLDKSLSSSLLKANTKNNMALKRAMEVSRGR